MDRTKIKSMLENIPDDTPVEFYFADRFSNLESIADVEKITIEYVPDEACNVRFLFTNYFRSDKAINLEVGELRRILDNQLVTDETLFAGTDNLNLYPLEQIDISYTNGGYKVRLHLKEELEDERNSAA